MAAPYRTGASLTVSQSPLATLAQTLPETVLSFMQLNQQMEWKSVEAALDREFRTEQNQLSMLNEESRFLREQKFNLMDQLKGYKIPEEITQAGSNLLDGTLGGYESSIDDTRDDIDALYESLNEIEAGKQYAKTVSNQYGAAIKANEDKLFKDYMAEGDITVGEGGKLIGTSEMAILLEDLRKKDPTQLEKLKGDNYRQAVLSSLRTMEEAKDLEAKDTQIKSLATNIEAAEDNIRKNNFTFAVEQLTNADKQARQIMKQHSLVTKSNFAYTADGVRYSLTDLKSYAGTDLDKFIEIKTDFLKNPSNAAISAEADAFISGIQEATVMGMDDSEFVVRFEKSAWDTLIELNDLKDNLVLMANGEGYTGTRDQKINQILGKLPASDKTKLGFKRLQAKSKGFEQLGMYKAGSAQLDRSSGIINLHNLIELDMLNLDMITAEDIADKGLQYPDPEDIESSDKINMTPEMLKNIEWSMEFLQNRDTTFPGSSATDTKDIVLEIQGYQAEQKRVLDDSKTKREAYGYATRDFFSSYNMGGILKSMKEDVYSVSGKALLQNIQGTPTGAGGLPAGYVFSQEDMDYIKQEVFNRVSAWKGKSGGPFSRGSNDAIRLLESYQTLEDRWTEIQDVPSSRSETHQKILEALDKIQ